MKTFGLWMILFVFTSISLSLFLKNWEFQDIIIESTLFSYILYKLLKD